MLQCRDIYAHNRSDEPSCPAQFVWHETQSIMVLPRGLLHDLHICLRLWHNPLNLPPKSPHRSQHRLAVAPEHFALIPGGQVPEANSLQHDVLDSCCVSSGLLRACHRQREKLPGIEPAMQVVLWKTDRPSNAEQRDRPGRLAD